MAVSCDETYGIDVLKARKQLVAGRPEWARGNKRFLKMEKRLAFDVRSPDIARIGGRARRVLEEDMK